MSEYTELDSSNQSTPLIVPEGRRKSRQMKNVLVNVPDTSGDVSSQNDLQAPEPTQPKHRLPYHMPPQPDAISITSTHRRHSAADLASIQRYRYYNRLTNPSTAERHRLVMPDHVIPREFFVKFLNLSATPGTQTSVVTIFAMWNTMLGTSTLSLPWAVGQSGFSGGIIIIFLTAILTFYTANIVLKSTNALPSKPSNSGMGGNDDFVDFSDVCKKFMGPVGEAASIIFSLITLLGSTSAFWVLMSNFLYNIVLFSYKSAVTGGSNVRSINQWTDSYCPGATNASGNGTVNLSDHIDPNGVQFAAIWSNPETVPFFLVLLIFPLVNLKSPTFFTKFNSLGTVSVAFIVLLIAVKSIFWGINFDFDISGQPQNVPEITSKFTVLTGIMSLALFSHNTVIPIARNQRNPENNSRDLFISYLLAALTYMYVGGIFYVAFPEQKSCIASNFLDNFLPSDILAFIARLCLLFQMLTVFPLLLYIFRIQFLYAVFKNIYPSIFHVLVLNVVLVGFCCTIARFVPDIGTIIRFSGAFCGLAYVAALPCLVYILDQREKGTLTYFKLIVHCLIIVVAVANFVAQFFI